MPRSRRVAIVFSLLLVASMVVTPISAAGFSTSGGTDAPRDSAASELAPQAAAPVTASAEESSSGTLDEDVPEVEGHEPRDLDGDGRYEDLDGSGDLTAKDLQLFMHHQHLPVLDEHPAYFDYTGDGDVGQPDRVRLFEALSDPGVIEPRLPADGDDAGSEIPAWNETVTVEHVDDDSGARALATGNGTTPQRLTLASLPRYHDGTVASAGPTVAVHNVRPQDSVEVELPVSEDAADSALQVYTRVPNGTATWEQTSTEYDAGAGTVRTDLTEDRQVTVLNASVWEDDRNVSVFDAEPAQNMSVMNCNDDCAVVGDAIAVGSEASAVESENGTVTAPFVDIGDMVSNLPNLPIDVDPTDDEEDDADGDDGDGDDGGTPRHPPDDDDDSSDDDPTPRHPPDDDDEADEDDDDDGSTGSGDSNYDDSDDGVEDDEDRVDETSVDISVPLEPEAVKLTTWYATTGDSDDVTVEVEGVESTHATSVGETGGTVDVVTTDVSEFGGEDVTISVETQGETAILEAVTLFHDTTGDGLVDVFEREPQLHPVTGNPIRTDPTREDTNGDGLADAEQIDTEFDGTEWVLTDARADPTMVDSDDDGLSDKEELHVWETDPLDPDSSGDGLNDLIDPLPLEESAAPELEFRPLDEVEEVDPYESEDLYLYVTAAATASADEIDSVEVEKCWEDPPGDPREERESECQSAPIYQTGVNHDAVDTQLPPHPSVQVPFSLHYVTDDGTRIPKMPDEIQVTVVEDTGGESSISVDTNEREIEVDTGVGTASGATAQQVKLTKTKLSFSSSSALAFLLRAIPVVGGAYAIDTILDSIGEDLDADRVDHETGYAGEIEASWDLPADDVDVKLPSGATYDHPELPEQDRKHGWEQIKELPGIEQPSDVGEIVENGDYLHEHDLIIGDNPNGPGEIALKLVQGILISAKEVVEDPQAVDDEIVIPSDKSHFTDRDRPEITRNSEIRRVIEKADEVYINGQGLFVFVLYEDGVAKVVHAFNHRLIDETDYEKPVVSTAYKLVDNPEQEVEDLRLGKQLKKIYPSED